MLSRRRFLWAAGLLAAQSGSAWAQLRRFRLRRQAPKATNVLSVYFGTDTTAGAKGIYHANFDTKTGQISRLGLAVETERPTFLAIAAAPQRRVLLAVNELLTANATVSGFTMDARTGALQEIGRISAGGAGPCYLSVDSSVHAAFVADYNGGVVSSYQVHPDGTLSGPVERVDYKDQERFGSNGPNAQRQDGPHPHSATISPDNRFVVVNDLGHDRISVFSMDPQTAKLTANPPFLFSNNRPGSGPRHVVFHPNGRWVYGINELDSTIDHYLWTTTHGEHAQALLVVAGPPVKTIAEDFPGDKNTAAEVAVAPNGFFLYASNRGENSLAVFSIDQSNGSLTTVQRIACGGTGPRHFTLDPSGGWVLCGNQTSNSVTVFRRDAGTGRLDGPVQTEPLPAPMFTLFV